MLLEVSSSFPSFTLLSNSTLATFTSDIENIAGTKWGLKQYLTMDDLRRTSKRSQTKGKTGFRSPDESAKNS
jgi:hypothetical protein